MEYKCHGTGLKDDCPLRPTCKRHRERSTTGQLYFPRVEYFAGECNNYIPTAESVNMQELREAEHEEIANVARESGMR